MISLKNTFSGIKGFLVGFFLILSIIFIYIYYSFFYFSFFIPAFNQINKNESTVLITLHNESELRPNLGFLTGFILLQKNKEGIFSMEFHDSYDISAPKKPIIAPDIIEKNFSADSRYQGWVFRDSNFNMQYSQNAKNAIAFLQNDKRYKTLNISAVISLDMHAIEEIIDTIGGINFENKIIYGNNFFSVLESKAKQFDRSDENAWKNRKGSIKPLAIAIIKKCITSVFAWKDISNTLKSLFADQHILFYSPQPNIQKIFLDNGISGNINLHENNIPWGLNIANIGGKKGDRYIEKNIKSVFSIDKNGNIVEKLKIQFSHNGTRNLHSDRYFGYIRIVKPKNSKLISFSKNKNYINTPTSHTESFPKTSEFDFFFFIDPSSQENLELIFQYPPHINVENPPITFDIFTQPGIVKMPTQFIFQAFADSQIKIDNCKNTEYAENISSCFFTAPKTPKTITITKKADTTLPIFEDVIFLENGKKIKIQFSEELNPIKKTDIFIVNKTENINIPITSIENKTRSIEITLKTALSSKNRTFYNVLINKLSDISGNSFDIYNTVIAYPKYK